MGAPARPTMGSRYKRHRQLLFMLAPVLAWYLLFQYGPLYGIQLAFKQYYLMRGVGGSPWVGLQHFRYMFTSSPDFLKILRNTLLLSVYDILLGFPAPIVLALLLNEIRSRKFVRASQLVLYLPYFFSWVVLSGFLIEFLSPTRGALNALIVALGGKPVFFLGDPGVFRGTLITTRIWREIGWGSIVYMASIAAIDPQLYEAAVVDGAGRLRQALSITLPGILPVVVILFILRLRGIMDAGFDQVLNLYNYSVMEVGDIIDTYVYRVGLGQIKYDFTTAVNLFKNVIALAVVIVADRASRMVGSYGLF